MSMGFLDAVIEAPPIIGEFNALAQGFRRTGEGKTPATPWPRNRAAWQRRHKKYRNHQRKIGQGAAVLGFPIVLAKFWGLRKIDAQSPQRS